MSLAHPKESRRIAFVAPRAAGEALRGAHAVAQLDNVSLLCICEDPSVPPSQVFDKVIQVDDVHDTNRLIEAARQIISEHGDLDQIVTVHETLLAAVATANETLGISGMRLSTVQRTLDKSQLKQVFRQIGIETARDRVITQRVHATQFAEEVGFPIVLKPLGGSGSLATWRVRDAQQLEVALDLLQPARDNRLFAEEHLQGPELCIDTVTVANEPKFFSICRYKPNILEALEDPQTQWRCIMPRDISGDEYGGFISQGLSAVRALNVGNAMTHMEGFLLAGGGIGFTDATLRPAGARIAPMLAFAYDIDPYWAWARITVDGRFDGPWERKYSVGTIFLRGTGEGQIQRVDGLQSVRRQLGEMLVDCQLPQIGNRKSVTYTGDGYITVRHPDTKFVDEALDTIARLVVVTYDGDANEHPRTIGDQWKQRLQQFKQRLYKPAWDGDEMLRDRTV